MYKNKYLIVLPILQALLYIFSSQSMESPSVNGDADISVDTEKKSVSLLNEVFKLTTQRQPKTSGHNKLFVCHINDNTVYVISIIEKDIQIIQCNQKQKYVEIKQQETFSQFKSLDKWVYFASAGIKKDNNVYLYGAGLHDDGTYGIYKLCVDAKAATYTEPTLLFTHAHPVVHLGIVYQNNTPYLVSGSLYPAIKIYNLTDSKLTSTWHNRFLLGTSNNTLLYAKKNNPPWTFFGRFLESHSADPFPCTLYKNIDIIDTKKEHKLTQKSDTSIQTQLSIDPTNYPIIGRNPSNEPKHAFIDTANFILYTIDLNDDSFHTQMLHSFNSIPIKLNATKKVSGVQFIQYLYRLLHNTLLGKSIEKRHETLYGPSEKKEFVTNFFKNFFKDNNDQHKQFLNFLATNRRLIDDLVNNELKDVDVLKDIRFNTYKDQIYDIYDIAEFVTLDLCYYIPQSTWLTYDNLLALQEPILLNNNCNCFIYNKNLYFIAQEISADTGFLCIYQYNEKLQNVSDLIKQDNNTKQNIQKKRAEAKKQAQENRTQYEKKQAELLKTQKEEAEQNEQIALQIKNILEEYTTLTLEKKINLRETYKDKLQSLRAEQTDVERIFKGLDQILYNQLITNDLEDYLQTISLTQKFEIKNEIKKIFEQDHMENSQLEIFFDRIIFNQLCEKVEQFKGDTIERFKRLQEDVAYYNENGDRSAAARLNELLEPHKNKLYQTLYENEKTTIINSWPNESMENQYNVLAKILNKLLEANIITQTSHDNELKFLTDLKNKSLEKQQEKKEEQKLKEKQKKQKEEQLKEEQEQEEKKRRIDKELRRTVEESKKKTEQIAKEIVENFKTLSPQEKINQFNNTKKSLTNLAIDKKAETNLINTLTKLQTEAENNIKKESKKNRQTLFATFKKDLKEAFKKEKSFVINTLNDLQGTYDNSLIPDFLKKCFVHPVIQKVCNNNTDYSQFKKEIESQYLLGPIKIINTMIVNYENKVLFMSNTDLKKALQFVIDNGEKAFPNFVIKLTNESEAQGLWQCLSKIAESNDIQKNEIDAKKISLKDQARLKWLSIAIAWQTELTIDEKKTFPTNTEYKTLETIKQEIIENIEKLSIDDNGKIVLEQKIKKISG